MTTLSYAQILGGLASLGSTIGIGSALGKIVFPLLFKRNGKSEYVPRTECKIIHAGQDKRHEDLMTAIGEIKEDIRAINK